MLMHMTTIIVNEKYCKGCGICIEICPEKVFEMTDKINEMGYHIPDPINRDKCILCHQCEMYCPDQAIVVLKDE